MHAQAVHELQLSIAQAKAPTSTFLRVTMPASPAMRKLAVLRDARVSKRAKMNKSGSGRVGEGSFLDKEGDWFFGAAAVEAAGKQ